MQVVSDDIYPTFVLGLYNFVTLLFLSIVFGVIRHRYVYHFARYLDCHGFEPRTYLIKHYRFVYFVIMLFLFGQIGGATAIEHKKNSVQAVAGKMLSIT